jgi:hypothetical protein
MPTGQNRFHHPNEDLAAAERKLEFFIAVGTDPIFGHGDYPQSCKNS